MIALDFTKLAEFLRSLPHATQTCRLCRGEPLIPWEKKHEFHVTGATHHTCYPGEELMTLARAR